MDENFTDLLSRRSFRELSSSDLRMQIEFSVEDGIADRLKAEKSRETSEEQYAIQLRDGRDEDKKRRIERYALYLLEDVLDRIRIASRVVNQTSVVLIHEEDRMHHLKPEELRAAVSLVAVRLEKAGCSVHGNYDGRCQLVAFHPLGQVR